ncbi:MAG: DUF2851 family protein [Chitinophagaceae bacterium]|nr:DUF2851 family protein [Chitinophagaceae bacterium]
MNERLLHFIWQFQYFNKSELASVSGEKIEVLLPGRHNTNQGPDFLDAKIKVGNTVWAGTVELHIKTSDWKKHRHHNDPNYQNVILHVVWDDDGVHDNIPVFELKERVSKILLQRYEDWMGNCSFIPCEKSIPSVPDISWKSWKERLLAERLMRKAGMVEMYLQQNNFHWEETFWWLLARSFGMKVNADAFEAVARSVPLPILAKQKNQLHQLEALLSGQAGLLEKEFKEDYPVLLQKEYKFQQAKYQLKPISIPFHFLRMRPGNFPGVRLAQLAMLIHGSAHLFSKIKEASSVKEVKEWFNVMANDYWHYHYRYDEISAFKKKIVGSMMADNIIINTVAPVLFAYGNYQGGQAYKDKALQWLEATAAEKNFVTRGFQKTGIISKTAYDSQALIELKTQYCDNKMCLSCAAGNAILRQTS